MTGNVDVDKAVSAPTIESGAHPPSGQLFSAPGEMAERCRAFDWASTPLGPPSRWSQSLRTMADAVLASRNPMLLFWGPELIQFYNDAFRPSLGFDEGPHARHPRALGMSAKDFWTDVWSVVGPQIEGVMRRGEAVWFEELHLPIERDGKLDDAWWTYSYSPVRDDDGRINGTLVVCIEVTAAVVARRELLAERARAEGILQSMADAYFAVDGEFRFVATNRAMEEAVGRTREQLVGHSLWELFPGTVGTPWEEAYRRAIRDRRAAHVTLPYRDRDLDIVAETDIYPTPDGGLVAFWRNVTQREQAAAERERLLDAAEEARRGAEHANRAKADFLAVMSHELRTPLNAIGGYTELLELGVHGPVTEAMRAALDKIQRSQRHLLGLINGVLNYAKIDAGAVRYEVEPFAIEEVLATCEVLVAPQAAARGITLERIPVDGDVRVLADREKVQQIVINLLGNAVKFTEAGGSIRMECRQEGGSSGFVVVEVRDTGSGIPAERLEGIFQPFVQLDSRLTRTNEGVGLGLAISRDLARGMNGDITVSSEVGVGSTFTLVLPSAGPR